MAIQLPGHLFQTYASYKSGTNQVIKWLHKTVGQEPQGHVNCVRELEALADIAVRMNTPIPYELMTLLQQIIQERNGIGNFFKDIPDLKCQEANLSHAHFTGVLKKIYKSFRPLLDPETCSKKQTNTQHLQSQTTSTDVLNIFEWLDCEECIEDDTTGDVHNESKDMNPPQPQNLPKNNDYDIISEIMDLGMYLSQLEKLSCLIQNSWLKAAAGSIPVAVAALITQISCNSVSRISPYLKEYRIREPHTLSKRYQFCMESFAPAHSSPSLESLSISQLCGLPSIAQALKLEQTWFALQSFKKIWKAKNMGSMIVESCSVLGCECDHDRKKPSGPAPRDNIEELFRKVKSFDDEQVRPEIAFRRHLDLILERMGTLIVFQSKKGLLLDNLKHFLQSDETFHLQVNGNQYELDGVEISFGILTLLESLKTYYGPENRNSALILQSPKEKSGSSAQSPNREVSGSALTSYTELRTALANPGFEQPVESLPPKPTRPPNCRVSALRFTEDFRATMEKLKSHPQAPCHCLQFKNAKVRDTIDYRIFVAAKFVSVRNFDLYYQSPWVSGMDIVHGLYDQAHTGLMTWHSGYHVGTVMHVYNSLAVLGRLDADKFPFMQSLCSMFRKKVFLGHQPQRNLWSCYQRWCGAKLSFPSKKCHNLHSHGRKWTMEKVDDRSMGGNDRKRRFTPESVSWFAKFVANKSIYDDDTIVKLYNPTAPNDPNRNDIQKARDVMESEPFLASHMLRIQDLVMSEFSEEYPIAKLNYLEIYMTFCNLLQQISTFGHPTGEKNHICDPVMQRIICGADSRLDDPHYLLDKSQKMILEAVAITFEEVLGGKKLSDFTMNL